MSFDVKSLGLGTPIAGMIVFGATASDAAAPAPFDASAVVGQVLASGVSMATGAALAQTWNNGATTFTGLKVDVTATAYDANSLLLNLQVDSSSKLTVDFSGLNLYNVHTSDTDFERGFMRFASNILEIGGEAAGAGATRNVTLMRSVSNYIKLENNSMECRVGPSANHRFTFNTSRFGPTQVDSLFDLGSANYGWRDLYVSRNVFFDGLPTSDPAAAGQLWNNSGTLAISAG